MAAIYDPIRSTSILSTALYRLGEVVAHLLENSFNFVYIPA